MKKHLTEMKIRQEEIDRKISTLKHREGNNNCIKREKTVLKKALIFDTEKKKSRIKYAEISKRKKRRLTKE